MYCTYATVFAQLFLYPSSGSPAMVRLASCTSRIRAPPSRPRMRSRISRMMMPRIWNGIWNRLNSVSTPSWPPGLCMYVPGAENCASSSPRFSNATNHCILFHVIFRASYSIHMLVHLGGRRNTSCAAHGSARQTQ